MSKGLEALKNIKREKPTFFSTLYDGDMWEEDIETIEKELKAQEVIKKQFRLVGNCLHAKNKYAEDGWVFVKEIENDDELNAWKEVLE